MLVTLRMRTFRASCALVTLLSGCGSTSASPANAAAGSGPDSPTNAAAGSGSTAPSNAGAGMGPTAALPEPTSCTGQDAVCPSMPFGLCTEVQMVLGICRDWSKSGATQCTSPLDCPATFPPGHFTTAPSPARAICVKATDVVFTTDTSAGSGYCAATQTATDPDGVADCTTNPCGGTGYCSYVRDKSGTTVVSCTWPV